MKIDETKLYSVKLSRLVKIGAFSYRPLNEIKMNGSVLAAIIAQEGEEVVDYVK